MSPKVARGRAFARAGLLGNPSDGYFGRSLSVVLRDFQATVTLEESAKLAGSGGAIIGVLENEEMGARVRDRLGASGARVIEPMV